MHSGTVLRAACTDTQLPSRTNPRFTTSAQDKDRKRGPTSSNYLRAKTVQQAMQEPKSIPTYYTRADWAAQKTILMIAPAHLPHLILHEKDLVRVRQGKSTKLALILSKIISASPPRECIQCTRSLQEVCITSTFRCPSDQPAPLS